MPMKGQIQEDHISTSDFTLSIPGLPDMVVTKVSGLDEELETSMQADRTNASGGITKAIPDWTFTVPAHHGETDVALEAYFRQCQLSLPGYKRPWTLSFRSVNGNRRYTMTLLGSFLRRRVTPEGDMEGEAPTAYIEWGASTDQIARF